MKRAFLILVCVITIAGGGCAIEKGDTSSTHCILVEKEPGKLLLGFSKREWGGFYGPEGYVGYRYVGYWAALEGDGPEYVNPHFQDNPSEFKCVGTITLDKGQNEATVKMQRVVSKEGEPERTTPHPANGTYHIEIVRKAKSYEHWF
jgi:hypothetical protein